MQVIFTKYLPASSVRGSRIKAFCDAGEITIDYPHDAQDADAAHTEAANALCAKLAKAKRWAIYHF